MAPEEIDLTAATPPKKMKQARLPFAPKPVNKQATAPASAPETKEVTRKRKLSGGLEAEENKTPSKAARTESKSTEEAKTNDTSIKSRLAVFAHKDEPESKKAVEKKDKRKVKPKKDEKKSPEDDEAAEEQKEKDGGKFHGLLKMPFKKTKKKEKKETEDIEDDFDLILESSVDESALTEESSMTSVTSMTEEWAKFHENQDTDQSMEETETGSKTIKIKKTKMEKQKEKEDKLKKKQEQKALKEEEKAKAKANKEKQKQLQKEDKPEVKNNPLAKFLSLGKDTTNKPASTTNTGKKDLTSEDDVVVDKISSPSTSTPIRTAPGEKLGQQESSGSISTSCSKPEIKQVSPNSPDLEKAQKLNIAKLKVKVTELDIEMEEAVKKKDYLKAHQFKKKIEKLEESIKKSQSDPTYTDESLLEKEPKTPVCPKTPQTPRNVSVVSTPGSSKKSTSNSSKKEALEKERKAKKELLEKEKQAKKEALENEKQAKKEAKEKERIEREKQKEIEKQAKNEEKLEKEKQKKAEKEKAEAEKLKLKQEKEEEKLRKKAEKEAEQKQKEEEKRQQEMIEKEKAKKEANVFMSFFKKEDLTEKKENGSTMNSEEKSAGNLTAFRVKDNMRLAPLVRADTDRAKRNIDSLDMPCGPDGLYLAELRGDYTPGKQGRTWPYEKLGDNEPDVEILEDEDEESDLEDELNQTNLNIIMRKGDKSVKIRAKLLKFHENQRPAYWGTWTKQSTHISGRRPFGKDEERFDYDYDSDDDWEEEEEGESLSDDEKDKEDEEENEDYEVDNEFFVPHGYLSDEEEDKEDDEVLDPETSKEKQKLAARAFEKEHKKKTTQLKPRLWGCYFPEVEDVQDAATLQMVKILSGFSPVIVGNNNLVNTNFSKKVVSPAPSKDDALASAKTRTGNKGLKAKAKVKAKSPAPSAPANLITKFARVLTDQEKEELKAKQEKEAQLARQKKEEQAAKLTEMKAELAAKQVGSDTQSSVKSSAAASPLQMFTKTLSEIEKAGKLSSETPTKKRAVLTPVPTTAKNNPIAAISSGPSKATAKASPIAVKRKPGKAGPQASPIAVKRKPGGPSPGLSFKGLIPESVTVSPVSASAQDPVECVTIED